MTIDEALRDLAEALTTVEGPRSRGTRMRQARQVLASRCLALLEIEAPGQSSVADAVRLAAESPLRPARRTCAALLVHALAVPGLVPAESIQIVCMLVEGALRDVLLRCGYPFGGTVQAKMQVLERLHATIGELMQPMEPTFPNWIRGLHAG
jgi:hypothetical protein